MPLHTFQVSDGRYFLTFALMFALGLVVSELAARLRRQEAEAVLREARTARLYATNRAFAEATDSTQIAAIIVRAAADIFVAKAYVLATTTDGESVDLAAWPPAPALNAKDRSVAEWSIKHNKWAGLGTDTLNGAAVLCVPIGPQDRAGYGLVIAPPHHTPLRSEQREFLDAFIRQAALAFDRLRLATEARVAAISAQTEEMRSTLLSAVSHDLRTPLAAITGAATALRSDRELAEPTKRELLDAICEQADKMDRLIANLLSMTRLEAGGLSLKLAWVPLEEVIGSALGQVEAKLGDRPVAVHIDAEVPFIAVDPVLFEQIFVNLFENAIKYAPGPEPLELVAKRIGKQLQIDVLDRGPGFASDADADASFNKFYRGPHVGDNITGAGLGLAICRGLVAVHGGQIEATNREGGGARFRITMPLAVPPASIALTPAATAVTP